MKVIIFGATGMVGQGALRECLLAPDVERVLTVGRRATGQSHEKLQELVHQDFTDFSSVEDTLAGYDACFFCLGISSVGMKEEDYRRVTYDYALAAARSLLKRNPGMTFVFVSGAHTDGTGQGPTMWARVKGQTENALLEMPFKASYMFRPAYIHPMDGVTSRTGLYRAAYVMMAPLYPLLKALFPKHVTTTRRLGRAMLNAVRHGAPKRVLENVDINSVAGEA